MEQVKKIFQTYSAKLKKLKDFERQYGSIIRRHFRLQEMEMRAKYKAQEQVDMIIEKEQIKDYVFLHDRYAEMRIYPQLKTVSIFDKSKYKKQPKCKSQKTTKSTKKLSK